MHMNRLFLSPREVNKKKMEGSYSAPPRLAFSPFTYNSNALLLNHALFNKSSKAFAAPFLQHCARKQKTLLLQRYSNYIVGVDKRPAQMSSTFSFCLQSSDILVMSIRSKTSTQWEPRATSSLWGSFPGRKSPWNYSVDPVPGSPRWLWAAVHSWMIASNLSYARDSGHLDRTGPISSTTVNCECDKVAPTIDQCLEQVVTNVLVEVFGKITRLADGQSRLNCGPVDFVECRWHMCGQFCQI